MLSERGTTCIMNHFKEFFSCPNCGSAICGEKKEYFVCPNCGSALCAKEQLPKFDGNYCGHCGSKIVSAKSEALAKDIDVK